MRFIIGIIGVVIGLAIIRYRSEIRSFTGVISFAENYFGSGGTYTFYLLLGIIIIFLSVLFGTGQLQGFLGSALSPYF